MQCVNYIPREREHLYYCISLKLFPSFCANQEFWSLALWYCSSSLTLEELSNTLNILILRLPPTPTLVPPKFLIRISWERNEVRFFPQARKYFCILKPLLYLLHLFNLTKEGIVPPKDGVIYSHSQSSSVKEFACLIPVLRYFYLFHQKSLGRFHYLSLETKF